MFKSRKIAFVLNIAIRSLIVIIMLVILYMFFDNVETFGSKLWIMTAICVFYFVIYFIATSENRKRKRENKITLWDMPDPNNEGSTFVDTIEMKKYQKLNKKRAKKGLEPLSKDEFLDHEENNCEKTRKLLFLYFLAPLAAIIVIVCVVDFEGLLDKLIFMGITYAVCFLVELPIWKFERNIVMSRLGWIKNQREDSDD